MTVVEIDKAKRELETLLARVDAGEEILIARSGRPVARLSTLKAGRAPRRPNSLKGRYAVPDDFDKPLSDEEVETWMLGEPGPPSSEP